MDMIFPAAMLPGDRVAIVSPATMVRTEYIDGAAERLRHEGYEPVIMPHAKGPAYGSFASSVSDRLDDLRGAWCDDSIRAILCARGGYGCVQLLDALGTDMLRQNPKWLIGFSDISALHALSLRAGVASVHGPMGKQLTQSPPDDKAVGALFEILSTGNQPDYETPAHPYDQPGVACGRLIGGNMAVLNGLGATPYDLFQITKREPTVIFLEDVGEQIYEIDRMLWRLYLSGILAETHGLIIGEFTEYRPDLNFESMEQLISTRLSQWGLSRIPVMFGFPVGHGDNNYPLVEGAQVRFETGQGATRWLRQIP